MEVFGIIGFIFGLAGVSMAIKCQTRIEKLEKKLKEKEVLGEDYNWKQKP